MVSLTPDPLLFLHHFLGLYSLLGQMTELKDQVASKGLRGSWAQYFMPQSLSKGHQLGNRPCLCRGILRSR